MDDGLAAARESTSLLADVAQYILARPARPTQVRFASATLRAYYQQRILQRLGISVADYEVLNIHRIGVEAPAILVWDALQRWNAGSGFWPDKIAAVAQRTDPLDQIRVSLLGLDRLPLFRMTLLKRQDVPPAWDVDNARFLLYRCSGGYPIGVFSIYVRSGIAEEGETEPAQVFVVVAFNFYGLDWLSRRPIVRAPWQRIHNRVTANVLNRLKALCEAEFRRLTSGTPAGGAAAASKQS